MRTPDRIAGTCLITAFTCIIASALTSCSARPDEHYASSQAAPASPANTVQPTADVDVLLPLPRAELTVAVRLATGFAATYSTYRYDETPQHYLARLRSNATPDLYAALSRNAATPGTRAERTQEHETATAQAAPTKLRVIASDSLILILDVRQLVTTTTDTRRRTQHLAVTAVKTNNGDWAISDIQPATAGDQGDTSDAGTN
jgi:hypothetical protein